MNFRSEPKNIKNILIIGHANIGDICCDAVLIGPLKLQFPQAKIYFLTSPISRNLLEGYKGIEEVLIIDKKNKDKTWGARFRFNKGLWKYRFDMIIVLKRTLMHRFLLTRHVWDIRKVCKADFASKKIHPIDIYLNFLKKKNVKVPEVPFSFNFDHERIFCEKFLEGKGIEKKNKLIGIFPLAAWIAKNWPVEKWNELSEILWNDFQIKTIALGKSGGEGHAEFTKYVKDNLSPVIVSAIDQTSLKQAAALIQSCHMFIGPDSSLLHLASCMKVESVGLYGPTPVDYIYPYYHKSSIILPKKKEEGMLCQSDPLRCPCMRPQKTAACMEKIKVEEVLQAVITKLNLVVKN